MLGKFFASSGKSSFDESTEEEELKLCENRKKKRSNTVTPKTGPTSPTEPAPLSSFQILKEKRRSLQIPTKIIIPPEKEEPLDPVMLLPLDFVRCDTYWERMENYQKLTEQEIETLENSFKNQESVLLLERCKFCEDQLAVAELSGCKEKFCNGCLGMFYGSGQCSVCDTPFTHVKNLKTGDVVKVVVDEIIE